MKLLEEIPAFPAAARGTLETEFGIETAEAFYAYAANDPEGTREALHIKQTELDRLSRLVEAYLSPAYIERCHRPARRHARGVITD